MVNFFLYCNIKPFTCNRYFCARNSVGFVYFRFLIFREEATQRIYQKVKIKKKKTIVFNPKLPFY